MRIHNVHMYIHMCMYMYMYTENLAFPFLQWKSAPKSKLMDSKLRCVFVEGEPREPAPEQESPQVAPDTQERVRTE